MGDDLVLACVAGGSGYPRELRSRTRVQKAAQVARRMGRSHIVQANLNITATLGTKESGHYGEVVV